MFDVCDCIPIIRVTPVVHVCGMVTALYCRRTPESWSGGARLVINWPVLPWGRRTTWCGWSGLCRAELSGCVASVQ